MAWTSGFFNSIDGDRTYNAEQMSRLFEGLITNGVYASVANKLAVEPNNGLTIQINTGRGFFSWHWVDNDSPMLFTLEEPDVLMKRYAAVVIKVDDSDDVRDVIPYIKYGDFATDPIKPAMTRSEKVNEYCLAYVLINANATTISASAIEDTRGNTDLCGWVTGIIEQVDTSTLYAQYQANWAEFMEAKESESDAWMEQEQASFDAWFETIQNALAGDVAANLAAQIQTVARDVEGVSADVTALSGRVATLEGRAVKSSGTLASGSWSGDAAPYTQTITVSGVTASNDVIVSPAVSSRSNYLAGYIDCTAQGDNTLTFSAQVKPSANIAVDVIVVNF